MLKKIVLGALLTGLVAVLVWGAVNRTNAKGSESSGETGRRNQVAESVTVDAVAQGSGSGGGRWAQGGAAAQGGARDQAPAGQSGLPQADVQPDAWRTLEGTVVSVADDLVEIRTAVGEVIPFEGRPLSFALEQGFSLEVGDAVALAGFDEDGEFKISQVTSNRASITLRDASGRPGWAGRGRQG